MLNGSFETEWCSFQHNIHKRWSLKDCRMTVLLFLRCSASPVAVQHLFAFVYSCYLFHWFSVFVPSVHILVKHNNMYYHLIVTSSQHFTSHINLLIKRLSVKQTGIYSSFFPSKTCKGIPFIKLFLLELIAVSETSYKYNPFYTILYTYTFYTILYVSTFMVFMSNILCASLCIFLEEANKKFEQIKDIYKSHSFLSHLCIARYNSVLCKLGDFLR